MTLIWQTVGVPLTARDSRSGREVNVSLTYRTLTFNIQGADGLPVRAGTAVIVPSQLLTDSTDGVSIGAAAIVNFAVSSFASLVTTDNANIAQQGWYYSCTFHNMPPGSMFANQNFALPLGGGAPLDYSAVTSVTPAPPVGAVSPVVVPLIDAATILVNAGRGNDFRVTLGGNRVMGTPSNPTDGQDIVFVITQPGSGGPWALTWASGYQFGASGAPALSTPAGAIDMFAFKYDAAVSEWIYAGAATQAASVVPPAQGGTGQVTLQASINALLGAVTSGTYARGNGTNVLMSAIQAADVPQLADYAPTGLTGATAASRYAGATASAAPVSGTFALGDFVIDQTGKVWVCTTAGTPGTWTQTGGSGGSAVQNTYLPADDGLVAAAFDPAAITGSGGVPFGGAVYFSRIPIRTAVAAANLVLGIGAANGVGVSSGTFVGLYAVSGTSLTKLTGSADVGSLLTSGSLPRPQALPFSSSQSLTAGQEIYGAYLVNLANAQPSVMANSSSGGNRGYSNMNVGGSVFPRFFDWPNGGSGTTVLPASGVVTTSNIDVGNFSDGVWMGIS